GGQKVYPAEIEDIILELENVQDVAVYSERNALLGNIIVAQVVPIAPEPVDSLKKRIRKACSEKLAAFKVPAKVVLAEKSIYSARQKKMRRSDAP
ncbi:MAG: long-chain fatty acid--CoA ligase, partial [Archangium sp.]|nr:long-chain fatty acid--CoA ligase [Archangium sp.]